MAKIGSPSNSVIDEKEYEEYMRLVFQLEERERQDPLLEPLRDEDGAAVDGCYRVLPASVN